MMEGAGLQRIPRRIKTEMKIEPAKDYSFSYEEDESQISDGDESVEVEFELEEDFHAVMERIKRAGCARTAEHFVDRKPTAAILSDKYLIPRSEHILQSPEGLLPGSNHFTPLTSLCRLCATRSNAMVHILGPNEVQRNILKQIEYCLPIAVRKTDTLSKQACGLCLEKLEFCYRFHKSVAEAEKLQLLMCDEQASGGLGVTEKYCGISPLRDEHHRSTRRTTNEENFQTNDVDSQNPIPPEVEVTHATVENNVSPNSELHSEGLLPHKTYFSNYPDQHRGSNGSSNEHKGGNSAVDALNSGRPLALEIEHSACHSVPKGPINPVDLEAELRFDKEMCEAQFNFPLQITRTYKATDYPRKEIDIDDIVLCGEVIPGQESTEKDIGGEITDSQISEEPSKSQEEERVADATIHASTEHLPCFLCDKTFASEEDRKEHCDLEHTEGRSFRKRVATHGCKDCGKKFVTEVELQFHKLIHRAGAKTPSSGECDKIMESKTSMHQHVLTIHRRRKEPSNNSCGKQFRVPVEQHKTLRRKRHTSLECDLCKSRFRSDDLLQMHRKICCRPPSTDKNFPCVYCKKEFSGKATLTIHMRNHTGERPFRCDFCPKTFTSKAAENGHRRTHTGERPFVCSICKKTFAWASSFRLHAAVHTEDKPHKCPLCPQMFKTTSTRRAHQIVHTKERPHKCPECGAGFKRKYHLGTHLKTNSVCAEKSLRKNFK